MDSTKPDPYYVMGTGSRSMRTAPDAQNIFHILQAHILTIFEAHPSLVLISGMAEGWDEAIAKVAIFNKIPFIAAIPNVGYGEYYWGKNSLLKKDRLSEFRQLIGKAIDVVFVCDTLYVNEVHSNFIRNQWMVNKCNLALVYNATSSGTRDAVTRLNVAKKPFEEYPFTKQLALL